MKKLFWIALVALPLTVAGGGYATSHRAAASDGYICPVTGEKLPCPNCCPLNQKK